MKIALTHTGNPQKHQFYLDWLAREPGVQVLELSASLDNRSALQGCEGLVLSGGRDIHPGMYGSAVTAYPGAPEHFDWARDQFEAKVFESAQQMQIPTLAICRGLQLVNVVCRGSLVQHLPEKDSFPDHRGNPDKLHELQIEPGTLLSEIAGTESGKVNSAHHQAIDRIGEGLVANAHAGDGTIEGIEWKDRSGKAFFLGIQWHPERMFRFQLQDGPLSEQILRRFIWEVSKNIF
jgi:putative glutamine amidotransferase